MRPPPLHVEQAGDVLVGDRVVLARLHARLALAELRAADAQELEDATTEQRAAPAQTTGVVHREQVTGAVGEELERDRRGVEPFLAAALDHGTGDGRELVHGDGFDDRHAGDLSFSVLAH